MPAYLDYPKQTRLLSLTYAPPLAFFQSRGSSLDVPPGLHHHVGKYTCQRFPPNVVIKERRLLTLSLDLMNECEWAFPLPRAVTLTD